MRQADWLFPATETTICNRETNQILVLFVKRHVASIWHDVVQGPSRSISSITGRALL